MPATAINFNENPRYSIAEAARYLWVNPVTLTNWSRNRPVLTSVRRNNIKLSFNNLLEAHVLASLRLKHRVPMSKIRRGVRFLKDEYGTDYPLLHPDLATDGIDILIDEVGGITSASENGQAVMRETVEAYLSRIHRDEEGRPIRFFPLTRGPDKFDTPELIMLDPSIADGRPVITGTRISPSIILERFDAGDSPKVLAKDYDLTLEQVYEALRAKIERKAA